MAGQSVALADDEPRKPLQQQQQQGETNDSSTSPAKTESDLIKEHRVSSPVPGQKSGYDDYSTMLRQAWPDLPIMNIEYRDLSYVVPMSVDTRPKTLISPVTSLFESKASKAKTVEFQALRPTSGIIRPGTMTLILAPNGHGRSLFLKALSGRLHEDKHLRGTIRYNGLTWDEARDANWHINKLATFVDQKDCHITQLTVRETFEFAVANSVASASILTKDDKSGAAQKLATQNKAQLMIEMLGLTECSETILGNDMMRGVSGGQKKRVTVGEMLCTNARLHCLDQISDGLDSSAAYDVTASLQRWTRTMQGSVVAALMQPTPQTYELFDDVILMREGTVVYHGPRSEVIPHFAAQGIIAPPDQDDADFLVEFLSFPEAVYRKNRIKARKMAELSRTGYLSHRVPGASSQLRQITMGSQLHPHALNREYTQESVQGLPLQRDTSQLPSNDPTEISKSPAGVVFHNAEGGDERVVPIVPQEQQQQQQITKSNSPNDGAPPKKKQKVPLTTSALQQRWRESVYWFGMNQALESTAHLQGKPQGSFNMPYLATQKEQQAATGSQLYTHAQFRRQYVHSVVRHTLLAIGRQASLMKRNGAFIGSGIFQAIFMGLVLGSLFYNLSTSEVGNRFGLILFAPLFLSFGAMAEVPMSSEGKLVLYKQVDTDFYPAICYVISVICINTLIMMPQAIIFSVLVYFMSGFVHEAGRFFFFVLMNFVLALCWSQIFRLMSYALASGAMAEQLAGPWTVVNMLFAGFLITRSKIPSWLIEFYWLTPFSWVFRSLSQNEFKSSRYSAIQSSGRTLGDESLNQYQIPLDSVYKWFGVLYTVCVWVLLIGACAYSLTYQRFPLSTGTRRDAKQEEEDTKAAEALAAQEAEEAQHIAIDVGAPGALDRGTTISQWGESSAVQSKPGGGAAGALPFEPKDLTFKDLCYTIKLDSGEERQLLTNVSGFARAGQCTALMGSSGAGKTTLMDVIAGRKTGGKITGQILLDGHPKEAKTFNRLCGYVEQSDQHMLGTTVREALMFSARLRLPSEVTREQRIAYVDEVIHLLELKDIENRVVSDGPDGLSPGQMKRLTIGVEMSANPTLLFLDEPTSGLTSRDALLVMKLIKRVAQSGRTVLCTVHQPSAELFLQFDRLLLLRSGGRVVMHGEITSQSGEDGDALIEYFQGLPVPASQPVPLIGEKDNPASWMLEVIGAGTAKKRDDAVDFAELYDASEAKKRNLAKVEELSTIKPGSRPTHFDSVYASSYATQFAANLQRLNSSYWRLLSYNLTRFAIVTVLGLLLGFLYLQINDSDYAGVQSKLASLFMALGMAGVVQCASALPVLYHNRSVFYREIASNTYTTYAYSVSIGLIELPYIAFTTLLFNIPFYWMVGLRAEAGVFFQFLLAAYLLAVIFNYIGQFLVSSLPNILITNIVQGLAFTFIFLFGGVFIAPSSIPDGWIWVYYLNPLPKAFLAVVSNEFRCVDTPCPTIVNPTTGARVQTTDFIGSSLDVSFGKEQYWQWLAWLVLTLVMMRVFVSLALAKLNWLKR